MLNFRGEVKTMTKKQKIFAGVAFVILAALIVCVAAYGSRKNKMADAPLKTPEVNIERDIPQPDISDILSKDQKTPTSETSESGQTTSGTQSSSSAGNSNLLRETLKTAPPENSGYPLPKSHHFYEVEGSVMPDNKDYAELSIRMNSSSNYPAQLQELKTVILPVLGESKANQIIEIAKTKTDVTVQFYRCFETDVKKVCISSSGNNPLVSFQSWQR